MENALIMIKLMEDLIFYGLNGNSLNLPLKFMKANSIFVESGLIRIPENLLHVFLRTTFGWNKLESPKVIKRKNWQLNLRKNW